jgi:diguanylate cyclase (GGDEF)-like protein
MMTDPLAYDRRHGFAARGEAGRSIASTLLRLCERLTLELGVWECNAYEYVAARDSLLCQATWSTALGEDDIAFVGTENTINRHRDVDRVFSRHEIVVVHADDEKAGTPEGERMDHWGEKTALYVPVVLDDELLGVLELIERRSRREFDDGDLRLAAALADVAAVAIGNARYSGQQDETNARLNALLAAGRALTSTVVLEEVLELVAGTVATTLRAPACYIYEYDPAGDAIIWRTHTQADARLPEPDAPGTSYALDDFPWDRDILASGVARQVSLDSADLEPDLRASMTEWSEHTMLIVPLLFGDETVGMMEIVETQPGRRFSDDEAELARALGEQAAAAIRNAQLYRRETWRNERLVKVLDLSRTLSCSLEADDVINGVRAQLGALFPQRTTEVEVVQLAAASEATGETSVIEDELARRALEQVHPVQMAEGDRRRLIAPLVTQGRAEGWLEIVSDDRPFAQDEVELVQILANQMAAALDSTRLYAALAQQAITDGLTGLFNHRYFYERLRDEVVRATRYDLQLSLLMMDLDDFKCYNDRFGHPAGDRVLRHVADIMKAQLRESVDVLARYGGEEFAVILPHTPAGGAERVGERLSQSVGTLAYDLSTPLGALAAGERVRHSVEDTVFPGAGPSEPAHVTISVGIASIPAHARDAEALVDAADRALYVAKLHGKNRVEIFA